MNRYQLRELANAIHYKEGYVLHTDAMRARWLVTLPDNFGRYDSVTVEWDWFSVEPSMDEATALRLIFFWLAYAEDHDMRERFVVRGKRPFNPHREGSRIEIKHLYPGVDHISITYEPDNLRW